MPKQASLFRFFGSPPATKKKKDKPVVTKDTHLKSPKQLPVTLPKAKKLTPSPPVASRKTSNKRKAASTPKPEQKATVNIEKKEISEPQQPTNNESCAQAVPKKRRRTEAPAEQRYPDGTRMAVFWPEEDEWFDGEVQGFRPHNGKHNIVYDDGDEEWIKLSSAQFEILEPVKKKRLRKMIIDDDSSEDEYKPGDDVGGAADDDDDEDFSLASDSGLDEDPPPKPKAKPKPKPKPKAKAKAKPRPPPKTSKSSPTPRVSQRPNFANRNSSFGLLSKANKTLTGSEKPKGLLMRGQHVHHTYSWLTREGRRDLCGRKCDHPEFDARTCKVPAKFMKSTTPAMTQWWKVKSQNMDALLAFKVGKFYEIFHMDSDVAVAALADTNLSCNYMKGYKAHCGFPERAFGRFSNALLEQGYKVMRVEQTETPQMLKARNQKQAKKSKCVLREVCSMLTPGTRTFSALEQEYVDDKRGNPPPITKTLPVVLALWRDAVQADNDDAAAAAEAVKQKGKSGGSNQEYLFGFCSVDASTGTFKIGQFLDNALFANLRTLFLRCRPTEVLYNAVNLGSNLCSMPDFRRLLRTNIAVGDNGLAWQADNTVAKLESEGYLGPRPSWPQPVADSMAKADSDASVRALGGALAYLERCLIASDLVSHRRMEWYNVVSDFDEASAPSAAAVSSEEEESEPAVEVMVVDNGALRHLEILENLSTETVEGSLLQYVDHCVTAFGHRKMRDWLCSPLLSVYHIEKRQDAVAALMQLDTKVDEVRTMMKKLPDMQRLLCRVHVNGSEHRSQTHPDSRAIFYDSVLYDKFRINNFSRVLVGFEMMLTIVKRLQDQEVQSAVAEASEREGEHKPKSLLLQLVSVGSGFPDYTSQLAFFSEAFDRRKAVREGFITPRPGYDDAYDDSMRDVTAAKKALDRYLLEQRRYFKCQLISYTGKNKNRYQMEIPESVEKHTELPDDFKFQSQRKGYRRYQSDFILEQIELLDQAELRQAAAKKSIMRRMFAKFDQHRQLWFTAVENFAQLDCLMSLSLVARNSQPSCRPRVRPVRDQAFMRVTSARHPCVTNTFSGGNFIPNDIHIGGSEPNSMLLTGPNMGGKSTYLRQVAVCAILAQLGAWVPASACEMTAVDRIFTRLGASDNLLEGQSTFFVELAETAQVLANATNSSLVILDELGRGTSTFDGAAIATAVLAYLSHSVRCMTLFSTHYHNLVEEFTQDDDVALRHMACIVDPDKEDHVTFLYQLSPGPCSRSHGLNVARLASLPADVIAEARVKSKAFEQRLKKLHQAAKLNDAADPITDKKSELANRILAATSTEELTALREEAKRCLGL